MKLCIRGGVNKGAIYLGVSECGDKQQNKSRLMIVPLIQSTRLGRWMWLLISWGGITLRATSSFPLIPSKSATLLLVVWLIKKKKVTSNRFIYWAAPFIRPLTLLIWCSFSFERRRAIKSSQTFRWSVWKPSVFSHRRVCDVYVYWVCFVFLFL